MDKVRFGIIGYGHQGSHYADIFRAKNIKDGVVSAICDIDESKLTSAKKDFDTVFEDFKEDKNEKPYSFGNKIAYFTDYKKLAKSGLVDAVMIETPHYFHPEIAIYFLRKNINVLCDKPAGVYTAQVKKMNEEAKKSNALFTMMFNQRTNCVYRKMREIVQGGGIGSLQRVNWIITNWFRTQHYYDAGSWRASWKGEGGGVLINQCPHQLDLVSWIIGELPASVNAFCKYGKWHKIEVEDDVTAYFEYKCGATGVFITTTGEAPGTNRLEISGTKGKIICDNNKLYYYLNEVDSNKQLISSQKGFEKPKCNQVTVETDGKNEQHKGIINNFAAAILNKEKLFVSGEEGINGVELMNAIELSGFKNGKTVNIPVDEKEYLRFLKKKIKTSVDKISVSDVKEDMTSSF